VEATPLSFAATSIPQADLIPASVWYKESLESFANLNFIGSPLPNVQEIELAENEGWCALTGAQRGARAQLGWIRGARRYYPSIANAFVVLYAQSYFSY